MTRMHDGALCFSGFSVMAIARSFSSVKMPYFSGVLVFEANSIIFEPVFFDFSIIGLMYFSALWW